MIHAMERNYSGRGGVAPTPETLAAAIRKAQFLAPRREHVQQFHNVSDIVRELLDL